MTEKHPFMSQVSYCAWTRRFGFTADGWQRTAPDNAPAAWDAGTLAFFMTGPFGASQDEHEVNTTAFGHHDPFDSPNGAAHDEPPPPYESVVMGEGVISHLVRLF